MANTDQNIYIVYHVVNGKADFIMKLCSSVEQVVACLFDPQSGVLMLDENITEELNELQIGVPKVVACGTSPAGAKIRYRVVLAPIGSGGFWLVHEPWLV